MKEQIEEMVDDLMACHTEFYENGELYTDYPDMAENMIAKGWSKQEWISVDERLPDREGKYLVCTTNGNIGVGDFIDYYGKGTHLCFDCWAVTHWMPLPEAPTIKKI